MCQILDLYIALHVLYVREWVEFYKRPCETVQLGHTNYVAAKATYIRLLHGKIGILEGFFGPSSVHRGQTHIVLG